jgi:hypothetical protein
MILTKNSPEVAVLRDWFFQFRGMPLVPTLEKMVAGLVAQDFWDNHARCQTDLDRQNEGELSFPACMGAIWNETMRHEPFFSMLKRVGKA